MSIGIMRSSRKQRVAGRSSRLKSLGTGDAQRYRPTDRSYDTDLVLRADDRAPCPARRGARVNLPIDWETVAEEIEA